MDRAEERGVDAVKRAEWVLHDDRVLTTRRSARGQIVRGLLFTLLLFGAPIIGRYFALGALGFLYAGYGALRLLTAGRTSYEAMREVDQKRSQS